MDTVIHNPTDGIYAATDDYVHALEVRNPARMLFVAGTMGLDARAWRGPAWSTSWSWSGPTCATILASAGMTTDNIVRLTSYLRDRPMPRPTARPG
jgi:2-iminobutanoate/2-iminopropanoate deaminase